MICMGEHYKEGTNEDGGVVRWHILALDNDIERISKVRFHSHQFHSSLSSSENFVLLSAAFVSVRAFPLVEGGILGRYGLGCSGKNLASFAHADPGPSPSVSSSSSKDGEVGISLFTREGQVGDASAEKNDFDASENPKDARLL